MAQNVLINGVRYSNVPYVEIPKTTSGVAVFMDTSDATLDSGASMLNGVTSYSNGVKYTGSIQSKSAQTYTPTTSDQTIQAGQYLGGRQTIKGDPNLTSANIASGVTIFGVAGTLTSATITQDSTTKVLSIS